MNINFEAFKSLDQVPIYLIGKARAKWRSKRGLITRLAEEFEGTVKNQYGVLVRRNRAGRRAAAKAYIVDMKKPLSKDKKSETLKPATKPEKRKLFFSGFVARIKSFFKR